MSKLNGLIKIDKNVPLAKDRRGRKPKYPWAIMQIGDSFFTPVAISSMNAIRAMAQLKLGRKFICRREKGGTRIWRMT